MRIAGVVLFFCHPRRDAALGLTTLAEEVGREAMAWTLVGGGGSPAFPFIMETVWNLVLSPNKEEMHFSSFLASWGER